MGKLLRNLQAYHCIEQFRFGEQRRLDFSAAQYSASAALVRNRISALEEDQELAARRQLLAMAGQGQFAGESIT